MHITIIDDEKVLSGSIKRQLMKHQYDVSVLSSYKEFIESSNVQHTDIFLVDISLGDGSGIDIVRLLKKDLKSSSIPVIFISGHDSVELKVTGLDAGGDDYLVKPFDSNELLARIRSCLRKNKKAVESNIIFFQDIEFHIAERQVKKSGNTIHLSKKEKQILEFFLGNIEQFIPKSELIEKFWGGGMEPKSIDNTVNVTMCNLRKKFGDSFPLETIIGEGYILNSKKTSQ